MYSHSALNRCYLTSFRWSCQEILVLFFNHGQSKRGMFSVIWKLVLKKVLYFTWYEPTPLSC